MASALETPKPKCSGRSCSSAEENAATEALLLLPGVLYMAVVARAAALDLALALALSESSAASVSKSGRRFLQLI